MEGDGLIYLNGLTISYALSCPFRHGLPVRFEKLGAWRFEAMTGEYLHRRMFVFVEGDTSRHFRRVHGIVQYGCEKQRKIRLQEKR
jgi:hypothetical protein